MRLTTRHEQVFTLVLLPGDIVVFSVRVMLVGKAPCAGNGRRPWPARRGCFFEYLNFTRGAIQKLAQKIR